jgi:hypothetical protein
VFDRLKDFPPSEIDTVIPLTQKILQPIKSLRDLTRQLVQYSGKGNCLTHRRELRCSERHNGQVYEKYRAKARLLSVPSGGDFPDHRIKAAFVSGGLVLVYNALVDHAVDDRYRVLVGGFCCGLIALLYGFYYALDMRSHFRAKPHLVEPGLFRLAGAFLG